MNINQITLVTIALVAANVVLYRVWRRHRALPNLMEWRAGMRAQGIGVAEPCGYYMLAQDSQGMWIAYNPNDAHDWKEFYQETDARTFQQVAISNYLGARRRRPIHWRVRNGKKG